MAEAIAGRNSPQFPLQHPFDGFAAANLSTSKIGTSKIR